MPLYDDGELWEAIRNHAARLHPGMTQAEMVIKLRNLEEAVIQGRQVYDLCRNPLLLRMLFVLYEPENVPSEIHGFQLYQEYWKRRVKDDLRVGTPPSSNNAPDLSAAACGLAMAMVARGLPSLTGSQVAGALRNFNLRLNMIHGLQARGILKGSEENLHFFHQTFFEHAAAQAFLAFGGPGIELLAERFRSGPENLFLGPVFEQALIAGEGGAEEALSRKWAKQFLTSDRFSEKITGIYLYTHLEQVTPENHEIMIEILSQETDTEEHRSLSLHFLQCSANIRRADRWEQLWIELETIWRNSDWWLITHFLDVLERFSRRSPSRVVTFIDHERVLERLLEKHGEHHALRQFIAVISNIIPTDPTYGLNLMVDLYRSLGKMPLKSRKLIAEIILAIGDLAPYFDIVKLASEFQDRVKDIHFEVERDKSLFNKAIGRLMAWEWLAVKFNLRDILSLIPSPSSKDNLAPLNALAIWLANSEVTIMDQIWAYFMETLEQNDKWWAIALFGPLIKGEELSLPPIQPQGSIKSFLFTGKIKIVEKVKILRENLIKELERLAKPAMAGDSKARAIFALVQVSLNSADIPHTHLAKLLDRKELHSRGLWLDGDLLGPLLVPAYHGGLTVAKDAMKLLTANQNGEALSKVGKQAIHRLANLVIQKSEYWPTFLNLCLLNEDSDRMIEVLNSPKKIPFDFKGHEEQFDQWCNKLSKEASSRKRRHAYMLWFEVVDRGVVYPPPFSKIKRVVATDPEYRVRYAALSLIGMGLHKGYYSVPLAGPFLERMAETGPSKSLRDRAVEMLAFGLSGAMTASRDWLEKALVLS